MKEETERNSFWKCKQNRSKLHYPKVVVVRARKSNRWHVSPAFKILYRAWKIFCMNFKGRVAGGGVRVWIINLCQGLITCFTGLQDFLQGFTRLQDFQRSCMSGGGEGERKQVWKVKLKIIIVAKSMWGHSRDFSPIIIKGAKGWIWGHLYSNLGKIDHKWHYNEVIGILSYFLTHILRSEPSLASKGQKNSHLNCHFKLKNRIKNPKLS